MKNNFDGERTKWIHKMPIDHVMIFYASLVNVRRDGFLNDNDDHQQLSVQDGWDVTGGLHHDMELCRRRLRRHYMKLGHKYNEMN